MHCFHHEFSQPQSVLQLLIRRYQIPDAVHLCPKRADNPHTAAISGIRDPFYFTVYRLCLGLVVRAAVPVRLRDASLIDPANSRPAWQRIQLIVTRNDPKLAVIEILVGKRNNISMRAVMIPQIDQATCRHQPLRQFKQRLLPVIPAQTVIAQPVSFLQHQTV